MLENEGKWKVTQGLVGWWRLMDANEGVNDIIGNNDGVLSGGMGYGSSGGRRCAIFDGSDDHISITDHADISVTGNLTLSAWVLTTSSTYQMFLSKYNGSNPTNSYFLMLRPDITKFTMYIEKAGSGGYQAYANNSPVNLFDGSWHHVAGTYDGANIRTYIDGVFANLEACTGSIVDSTTNLLIGRASGGTPYYMNGNISDVRIYNRALSAEEIAKLARIY